jgi:hypothetical protein
VRSSSICQFGWFVGQSHSNISQPCAIWKRERPLPLPFPIPYPPLEVYRLMNARPGEIFEVYDKKCILPRLLHDTGLEAHVRQSPTCQITRNVDTHVPSFLPFPGRKERPTQSGCQDEKGPFVTCRLFCQSPPTHCVLFDEFFHSHHPLHLSTHSLCIIVQVRALHRLLSVSLAGFDLSIVSHFEEPR